jgi:hypothetical protein
VFMTREMFISIDPITSMHMGLCNCPRTADRAQKLGAALQAYHDEYLSDPANYAEYVAQHYMRGGAGQEMLRKMQEAGQQQQQQQAGLGGSSGSFRSSGRDVGNGSASGSGSGKIRERSLSGDGAGAGAGVSGGFSGGGGGISRTNTWSRSGKGTMASPIRSGAYMDSIIGGDDEKDDQNTKSSLVVSDFDDTAATPPQKVEGVAALQCPTLEQMFLGDQSLLLEALGASRRRSQAQPRGQTNAQAYIHPHIQEQEQLRSADRADCEEVYRSLVANRCRDASRLVQVVRWQLQPPPPPPAPPTTPAPNAAAPNAAPSSSFAQNNSVLVDANCITKLDPRLCLHVCTDLGIKPFLAMDVISLLLPYL